MTTRRTALLVAVALMAGLVAVVVADPTPAQAWTRPATRIAGADRYRTAVDISKVAFPSGAPAAVVASGTDFPDGLSAGPLAKLVDGPVLLTDPTAVPQTVRDELTRLKPAKVVVVGGTKAVSDAALSELAAASGVTPERISGPDRYATAAQVAARFPPRAPAAYVASGEQYFDALAGGAAAASQGVPLLLVGRSAAPAVSTAALASLAPGEARVLGGTGAVSDGVLAQIRTVVPNVRRIAGPDRYATAQAVAAEMAAAGGPPSEMLMATGSGFPDALAAAPLSAARNAPILLSAASCAPPAAVESLRGLGWPDVIMIGGTGVLSDAAGAATPCSPVPDGLIGPGLLLTTEVLPGPQVVHLITVDRSQGYDVRAVTTTNRVNGLRPVTGIARRLGALVAVNGDFFDGSGEPTHSLAVGGRMLRWGGQVDTLVGFDPDKPTYGFFGKPTGGIELDTGADTPTLPIGSVNLHAPDVSGDELVLLTPEWTRPIPVGEWCRAVLRPTAAPMIQFDGRTVEPESVESAGCSADPVPRGSDVLVAPPASAIGAQVAALSPGAAVNVRWKLHETDAGVLDAIGANATLVFGAQVASDVDGGACPFFCTRTARTAIAQRPDGNLLLAVVDQRPGWSIGMTPRELANYLVGQGAIDAANLDGGGSSAMAVRGVLANRPVDGFERSVNTSLVIVHHGTVLVPGG